MTAEGGLRKRRSFFVQVPRETVRSGLSWKELGLLTYLLDRPEGWDVRAEALARVGPDGKEATQSGLKGLRAKGHYRLERRRLLAGTFTMGTAVSEVAVPAWAAEDREFNGKAVPVVQQSDGTFLVQHKDGTLTDDGFGPEHVDEPPFEDDGSTGDGKPGSGEIRSTGDGKPDLGEADLGSPGALRENNYGRGEQVVRGGSHQRARAGNPSPENPPNYDKHGRTVAQCDRHVGSTDDRPCRACGDARLEFQAALTKRGAARARIKAANDRRLWLQEAGNAPRPANFKEMVADA